MIIILLGVVCIVCKEDFYDFFVPGEDMVMYESIDDLSHKCNYYLTHESERADIARRGYEKI